MQDTLVGLCAAGLWDEADALIDHLITLSEEELAQALQETHGTPKWTSLHYAAIRKPTPSTLKKLVESGADLEACGSSGSTPLHLAAWNGCEEAAQVLVANGANMEATSKNGRTPLMFAARRGDSDMMNSLIDLGADVQSRDQRGRSALHFAAQSGEADAMRKLFQEGAIDEPDENGVTAGDLAVGDAKAAVDDDLRSEWSMRRTLSEALNINSWRDRFAGLARQVSGSGSAPPSPPPSPESSPRASNASMPLGRRPVNRGELYAAVGAGVLISILLPLARGGGSES
ncbi:Ankyrin repeat containing protein [Gracilaria domingensis]|nr:Ankyrin repeat containing protein [Gracilaria domingensis]